MDFEFVDVWGLVALLRALKFFGSSGDSSQISDSVMVPREALQECHYILMG